MKFTSHSNNRTCFTEERKKTHRTDMVLYKYRAVGIEIILNLSVEFQMYDIEKGKIFAKKKIVFTPIFQEISQ